MSANAFAQPSHKGRAQVAHCAATSGKFPRPFPVGLHGSVLAGDVALSMATWRSDLQSEDRALGRFRNTVFFNLIIA